MSITKDGQRKNGLPSHFVELVEAMPPQAILSERQYQVTLENIDRLMACGRLTRGQSLYLETLVQLVQAYEASHHAIDLSGISGSETLRHLLDQHGMNASDLARVLEVHPSMGSKIRNGDRALTVEHIKKLARHFGVSPSVFLD